MRWLGRNKFRDLELVDKMGGSERIITNPSQWFTEQSVDKLYPIGTKLVVEDMVFRYGHIEVNTDTCWRGRGVANLGKNNSNHSANGYIPIAVAVAALAGAKSLTLTLGRYSEAVAAHTAIADEFKDGEVYLESSPWTGIVRGRIKSNLATSTTTVFALKEGIIAAISATPNGKLHWNHYAHVGKAINDSHASRKSWQVGCLALNPTADYYVWLQTWGPYLGQYGQATKPGGVADSPAVWFDRYGAFVTNADAVLGHQYAGHSLPCVTDYDVLPAQGWSPLIMLQIAP